MKASDSDIAWATAKVRHPRTLPSLSGNQVSDRTERMLIEDYAAQPMIARNVEGWLLDPTPKGCGYEPGADVAYISKIAHQTVWLEVKVVRNPFHRFHLPRTDEYARNPRWNWGVWALLIGDFEYDVKVVDVRAWRVSNTLFENCPRPMYVIDNFFLQDFSVLPKWRKS